MEKAGLYLHIPFCVKKCGYCDFYSVTWLEEQENFIQAICKEMELLSPEYQKVEFDTLYLGGGTPSLLSTENFERLWNDLHRFFHISEGGEFSLEANPGTIDREKLTFLRRLGFNRLSLGAQSFSEKALKFLGRIHTVPDIYDGFTAARQAGFDNINLDLISAFPGLNHQEFKETLIKAAELESEHLSCYTLIIEENTPFDQRRQNGEFSDLSADEQAIFVEITHHELTRRGYQVYEISNYARGADYFCRHNLKYWTHQPYLGLGPSAHSFFSPRRWKNHRSLSHYLQSLRRNILPVSEQETLDDRLLEFEYVFLHLRLKDGINLTEYQRRFHKNFVQSYHTSLHKLQQAGLLEMQQDQLKLTERGWLLADEVSSFF